MFFSLFPPSRAWFGLFTKLIFYWSLISSASKLASGGPDLSVVIFPGAPHLLLSNVFLCLFYYLIKGHVLDFGDGVEERLVREDALFNSFDGYTLVQALDFEVGLVEPGYVFP